MQISELNEIRNNKHKEFINRTPVNNETVFVYVGALSNGISNKELALFDSLATVVADNNLENVKVCFDGSFDGVKVVKAGKTNSYSFEDAVNSAKFIADFVA